MTRANDVDQIVQDILADMSLKEKAAIMLMLTFNSVYSLFSWEFAG